MKLCQVIETHHFFQNNSTCKETHQVAIGDCFDVGFTYGFYSESVVERKWSTCVQTR